VLQFFKFYFNTVGLLFPKHSAKLLIQIFSTPRSRVIREKEIEVLNQASKSKFSFQGKELRLHEWGEGERLAYLFHGWESNAGSLGAFVDPLLKEGYKVVACDGPAHGSSEGKEASLISFTHLAKELIKAKGKPQLAIGHSLGANVIMLLCYEEQLSIPISVLISPVNRIVSVFEGFRELIGIQDKIYTQMIKLISKRANYQLEALQFENLAAKAPFRQVLLMHDESDQITGVKHSEDIAKANRSFKYVPIQGSGHYKILWHKDTLNQFKTFLRE
jgi:alpha-beta hydrolase superfamily lysophospholipase